MNSDLVSFALQQIKTGAESRARQKNGNPASEYPNAAQDMIKGYVERWLPHLGKNGPRLPLTYPSFISERRSASINHLLNTIDAQNKLRVPVFLTANAFDVGEELSNVVRKTLSNSRNHVLVWFQHEPDHDLDDTPRPQPRMTAHFGSEETLRRALWAENTERQQFLDSLFTHRLRAGGAGHVISIDVWEEETCVASIYYATRSLENCNLMKNTIWKC